jgi:hypothetical protein
LTRALGIVLVVGVVVGIERGGQPIPANPRELPSLLERWTWKGPAEEALLADGVIYVRGDGRVSAITADDGRVLWETVCATGEALGEGPVVDGGKLAVAYRGNLVLLDRQTGSIDHTVGLGVVSEIVASPLLVVAGGNNDRVDLVRIDPDSGAILARREVGHMIYDVEVAGTLAVAIVAQGSSRFDDPDTILAAYSTDGLGEVWRLAFHGFYHLEQVGGSLYAAEIEGEGEDIHTVFRRIDADSGQLGPRLPQRLQSRALAGLTWEIEVVDLKEGSHPAKLRRNSTETGQPLWTADLPGDIRGWARGRNALYLHCEHQGGRGYFLVLDWTTGAVRHAAYGLRDVRGLFSVGDTLVAWQEGGLTAFSARSFGSPDRHPSDLRAEVAGILAGVSDSDTFADRREHVQAAVTDLKTLGPRALPIVAELVPRLNPAALLAAARVLGDGGYAEAAPPLAARLADPPPPPRTDYDTWDPALDVLGALSRIGGDAEVKPIAGVLNDSTRAGSTRRQALATLASIGTPSAVSVIETTLSQGPQAEPWWQAPSPKEFADLIGRIDLTALEKQARRCDGWKEMERIRQAYGGARVSRPDGGVLLLFHDPRIGGSKDLWIAEADESGRVGAGRFIGAPAEGPINASLEENALIIKGTGRGLPQRIDLSEIGADADRDGLSDLVEVRLRSDPNHPDTDGDGVPDSVDPAPNGAGAPQTEEQEIVHSVFWQFFMFEDDRVDGRPEPAIMVSDWPLQWRGRHGPTVTLDAAQDEQFIEEAGRDGIPHIFIRPGRQRVGRNDTETENSSEEPDERWCSLTIYRGGLDAVGYDILVRRLGRLWVIRECREAWIS